MVAHGTYLILLEKGDPLLVFPEGTRSRDGRLGNSQKGIGLLIAKSKVPVLPARIKGTHEILGVGKTFPRLGKKMRGGDGNVWKVTQDKNKRKS